jgi:hypothetical protein
MTAALSQSTSFCTDNVQLSFFFRMRGINASTLCTLLTSLGDDVVDTTTLSQVTAGCHQVAAPGLSLSLEKALSIQLHCCGESTAIHLDDVFLVPAA